MVRCAACDSLGASLRCGACHYARYCNAACQRAAWKAGHRAECKVLLTLAPPPAEAISRLDVPELIDLICSPSGRFPDTAKTAATALLRRAKKRPLPADVSLHALKGFLNILERLDGEYVDAVGALGRVMYELLDPSSAATFVDEDGLPTILHALRSALGHVPSEAMSSEGGRETIGVSKQKSASASSDGGSSSCASTSVASPVRNESDTAATFMLFILEYIVDECRERALGILQHREDASPAIVATLRRFSRSRSREVVESCCVIISVFAALNTAAQSALVAAGALSAVLDVIVRTGEVVPVCSFAALNGLVSNTMEPAEATVKEVHRELERIIDAIFEALTVNLVEFDAGSNDDASVLTYAAMTLASFLSYLPGYAAERSTTAPMSTAELLCGTHEPVAARISALVNALRSSCSFLDSRDGGCNAAVFLGAMSKIIDAAGWTSCREAVIAGAIPAILAALRKHGPSSTTVVISACTVSLTNFNATPAKAAALSK